MMIEENLMKRNTTIIINEDIFYGKITDNFMEK